MTIHYKNQIDNHMNFPLTGYSIELLLSSNTDIFEFFFSISESALAPWIHKHRMKNSFFCILKPTYQYSLNLTHLISNICTVQLQFLNSMIPLQHSSKILVKWPSWTTCYFTATVYESLQDWYLGLCLQLGVLVLKEQKTMIQCNGPLEIQCNGILEINLS